MKLFKKDLTISTHKIIVGFDVEWTKNYRIKNGNVPFCFSLVYINYLDDLSSLENSLQFGFISYYVDQKSEYKDLCQMANANIKKFLPKQCVFVGHQFSSDIGVLLSAYKPKSLSVIEDLQYKWRNRKNNKLLKEKIEIFDTRYDIPFKCKSRRLVDVCQEYLLDVKQPEIQGSMTKMQREFFKNNSEIIREKLTLLNLRHSLSAILLYLFYKHDFVINKNINVNRIIYNNTANIYNYVGSDSFKELID